MTSLYLCKRHKNIGILMEYGHVGMEGSEVTSSTRAGLHVKILGFRPPHVY